MKKSVLSAMLPLLAVLLFSSYTDDNLLNLLQAYQNKYISVNVKGLEASKRASGSSSHYGQCMSLTITNLTNKELNLDLETGRYFDSEDPGTQDMIVTKETVVKVAPKQKRTYKVFAMCGQKHNSAPSSSQTFRLGKMSSGNLLGLARLIEKKNYQNYTAQNAVWSMTDNAPIDGITTAESDHDTKKELVTYVCKAKNLPLPKEYTAATVSVKINFQYTLDIDAKVSIKLYKTDGTYVKDLLKEQLKTKGAVKESYWVTDADVPKGKYYAQLYVNGEPDVIVSVEL